MDDIKVVRMCAARGCILCILTPIFSIIPICIFELREGNKIGCAGPGIGIPVIYVLIISINQRCVFSVFRWMNKLVFPQSNENKEDNRVVGQISTDLRKHFIKALSPYSAPGRREAQLISVLHWGWRPNILNGHYNLQMKHIQYVYKAEAGSRNSVSYHAHTSSQEVRLTGLKVKLNPVVLCAETKICILFRSFEKLQHRP